MKYYKKHCPQEIVVQKLPGRFLIPPHKRDVPRSRNAQGRFEMNPELEAGLLLRVLVQADTIVYYDIWYSMVYGLMPHYTVL